MRLPQQQAAVIVLSNVAWSVTSELAHELAAMLMPHSLRQTAQKNQMDRSGLFGLPRLASLALPP